MDTSTIVQAKLRYAKQEFGVDVPATCPACGADIAIVWVENFVISYTCHTEYSIHNQEWFKYCRTGWRMAASRGAENEQLRAVLTDMLELADAINENTPPLDGEPFSAALLSRARCALVEPSGAIK